MTNSAGETRPGGDVIAEVAELDERATKVRSWRNGFFSFGLLLILLAIAVHIVALQFSLDDSLQTVHLPEGVSQIADEHTRPLNFATPAREISNLLTNPVITSLSVLLIVVAGLSMVISGSLSAPTILLLALAPAILIVRAMLSADIPTSIQDQVGKLISQKKYAEATSFADEVLRTPAEKLYVKAQIDYLRGDYAAVKMSVAEMSKVPFPDLHADPAVVYALEVAAFGTPRMPEIVALKTDADTKSHYASFASTAMFAGSGIVFAVAMLLAILSRQLSGRVARIKALLGIRDAEREVVLDPSHPGTGAPKPPITPPRLADGSSSSDVVPLSVVLPSLSSVAVSHSSGHCSDSGSCGGDSGGDGGGGD